MKNILFKINKIMISTLLMTALTFTATCVRNGVKKELYFKSPSSLRVRKKSRSLSGENKKAKLTKNTNNIFSQKNKEAEFWEKLLTDDNFFDRCNKSERKKLFDTILEEVDDYAYDDTYDSSNYIRPLSKL